MLEFGSIDLSRLLRRVILRLSVLEALGLGLLTSIALSWTIAAYGHQEFVRWDEGESRDAGVRVGKGRGVEYILRRDRTMPTAAGRAAAGPPDLSEFDRVEVSFGWPIPVMQIACRMKHPSLGLVVATDCDHCILGAIGSRPRGVDFAGGGYQVLPSRPVWHRLALSMILWGAAWWALLRTLQCTLNARRAWRVWTGRCASCGYQLDELAGRCSECGERGDSGIRVCRLARSFSYDEPFSRSTGRCLGGGLVLLMGLMLWWTTSERAIDRPSPSGRLGQERGDAGGTPCDS